MAISSYQVELSSAETESGAFEKVCPIKDFPDLFGDPNTIETTTLDDDQQTFIPGIKTSDKLAFTFNYEKAVAKKIKDDEGKEKFWKLTFSDGTEFSWKGAATLGLPGKGVDEVIEGVINITPSTPIKMGEAD